MNNANTFLPTVTRLAGLISQHYGCKLEYKELVELDEHVAGPARNGLINGSAVNLGEFLFIPLFLGSALIGAARLSNAMTLSENERKYLRQMIRLLLESSLNNNERIDVMEFFEDQAKSRETRQLQHHQVAEIIPLNRYRKNLFPFPEKDPERSQLNFPFLIESRDTNDIHKMALEIHERTTRYAFLPIEDINASLFSKPESICTLGSMTIFIKDLATVPMERQKQLVAYYRSQRDKDCPQVVAGTTSSFRELSENPQISRELLNLLRIGYLHMAQPFTTYKRENLLEFFYDSLTGRTSAPSAEETV